MNNASTYLSTKLSIKELCVNIFVVLEASNLRGTLLQFENSFEELNANIFAMVGTIILQNCLYLAWTGKSTASKIIQYTASKVFYANLLAMMAKSLHQNITEWVKFGIGQILERHMPTS